jgi:hypothetical protein
MPASGLADFMNLVAGQRLFADFCKVPKAVDGESQDLPFAAIVRGAKAASQLAEMTHPNRPLLSASEGQQVLISMAATSVTIG